jgi:hypothetical protein
VPHHVAGAYNISDADDALRRPAVCSRPLRL